MSRLDYRPGLDGLRGIGLIAVLLFHAEVGVLPGAWGGVSTFFTLSGFLICALLLREHDATGSISLKAFYARRARRLLPALLLTLAGVVVFAATVADSSQLRNLRGDVLASLAYVANWRFGLGSESYADLFASPSPVLHLWTVAIEEQFYLLAPPALALLLARRGGRSPVRPLLIAFAGAVAVLVASGAAGVDHDLIYFGTHTRAAELLAGALLAALLHRGTLDAHLHHLRWAGPAGLAAMLWVWAVVDIDDDVLYRGGFAAYGVLSALVVLAAATRGNAAESLLRREPVRTLGKISYGVYVFHWPLFRWLTPERTDLDDAPLLALRMGLALGAGWLSYHLLEQPIRRGRALHGAQVPVALGATVALVIAGTFATTTDVPTPTALAPPPPVAVDADGRPLLIAPRSMVGPGLRIAAYGDSIAQNLGLGLSTWANGTDPVAAATVAGGEPDVISIRGSTRHGCGLFGSVTMRYRGEMVADDERDCGDWRTDWAMLRDAGDPDVAVISTGPWEVTDLQLPGDDRLRHIGDPVVDAALRTHLDDALRLFVEEDVVVVWILAAHIDAGTIDGVRPAEPFPESDPARIDRYNELVREAVARFPDRAATIDLSAHLATLPGGEMDTSLRPDLIHFTDEVAAELAEDWLGPAIVAAYEGLEG